MRARAVVEVDGHALVGGRPAMISAATGAVALVVAPLVREHGLPYLLATVVLAGIFQVLIGAAGFAQLMRFVPRSVMVGFVNAVVPAAELMLTMADSILDDARRNAYTKGAARISAEPSVGDPAQEIITVAQDRQADLIVVGSRGRGRLAGLLLGSVAQKVMSLAHCPVVVVR